MYSQAIYDGMGNVIYAVCAHGKVVVDRRPPDAKEVEG